MNGITFLVGVVMGFAAILVSPGIGVLKPPADINAYIFSIYLTSKACFWILMAIYLDRKEH